MIERDTAIAALLRLMGTRDALQPKGLIRRLAEQEGADPVAVKLALGRLAREGVVAGVTTQGEPIGRVTLTIARPLPVEAATLTLWRSAMQAVSLADAEITALAPCHEQLEGFSAADLQRLASGLRVLRDEQDALRGTPRFILSARFLLGSSKLLNKLPGAALRAFGIAIDAIPDAPPYVVTAGPPEPIGVLLIENPHAFEEAVAAGCAESMGLIATFGYGLSRSGDAFGNSLVASIDIADRLIALVRHGNPPTPSALLQHPQIFFWGDLDREGLRIYASLKKRLPALRASALYHPMIEAMNNGDSHPYAKATAKDRQGAPGVVPDDARGLVGHCAERAVDQELVGRTDLATLCQNPFTTTR